MRKLAWLLTILMILTAVPHGAAFASPEEGTPGEEVVVGKFIFEGYWDIWGANGKWTNNTGPGSKNLTCESDPVCPSGFRPGDQGLKKLLARYELTRAEVIAMYPMTEDQYNDAGRRYGMPWGGPFQPGYYTEHYSTMPSNPRATIKSFDPQSGATVVKWTIDYPAKPNPADPTSQPWGPEGPAASTKDWLKNGEWDKIDLRFASKTDLEKIKTNEALEGWRVYFPAVVAWYGIPKPEMNLTAVSIRPSTLEPEPGQKYTGTVTFKNNSTMALSNVAVGFFNGKFHGYLKDAAGNLITRADFAPGEEKTFNFTWTAPASGTVTLKGVIDTPPLPDDYAETTEEDNVIEATVTVVGADIAVNVRFSKDSCYIIPWNGSVYPSAVINVKRKDLGPEPVKVKLTMNGPQGTMVREFELVGGKTWSTNYGVTMSRAGNVKVSAEAWPVEVQDINPANNKHSDTACFIKRDAPVTGPKEPGIHGELGGL